MEATRRAIRAGRRLAAAAKLQPAVEAWKAALGGAYEAQDYAGMFVLAKNLGEATAQLAERQLPTSPTQDAAAAESLLQEAVAYFDYALGLIDQCALRGVLGSHRALNRSVRGVETQRSEAKKTLEQLGQDIQRLGAASAMGSPCLVLECTTCGVASDKREVVLDESDDCHYCRACYDEYYASVEADDAESVRIEKPEERDSTTEALGEADDLGTEVETTEAEVEATETETEAIVALPESVAASPEIASGSPSEEDSSLGRWRHERVELGSLADFLAGKGHVDGENTLGFKEKTEATVEPTPSGSVGDEHAEIAAAEDHQEDDEEGEADDGEEQGVSAERGRLEYSIARLVEIRQQSRTECPESLLLSPVRDDGRIAPAGRARTDTKRKGGAKKPLRANKSGQHSLQRDQASTPAAPASREDPGKQATESIRSPSALPSLKLCEALRSSRQAAEAASGVDCTGPDAVRAMASALFDAQQPTAVSVLPFTVQTRLLS